MKTAYELAMERLSKAAPVKRLTDEQKLQLAELDSQYAAKIAEREISLHNEIAQAAGQGDLEKVEQLEKRLATERKTLQAELESKKDKVRDAQ